MRSTIAVICLITLAGCSSGDDDDSGTEADATTTVPTAAETTTTAPPTFTAAVVSETEIDARYRQGLARLDDGWLFSFNDALFRTDDALVEVASLAPAIPDEWRAKGYNHIGDIDVVGNVVYAPLEQPDFELGTQATILYNLESLTYEFGFEVAQHENSFVTVDPDTMIAYSMDRFGGAALVRYDISGDEPRFLDPLPMSLQIERVQGADVYGGAIWLSTDDATDGVYRVDLETGHVDVLGSMGHVDGEGEGIDAIPTDAGDLHVISLDIEIVPVRLIELDVIP